MDYDDGLVPFLAVYMFVGLVVGIAGLEAGIHPLLTALGSAVIGFVVSIWVLWIWG